MCSVDDLNMRLIQRCSLRSRCVLIENISKCIYYIERFAVI